MTDRVRRRTATEWQRSRARGRRPRRGRDDRVAGGAGRGRLATTDRIARVSCSRASSSAPSTPAPARSPASTPPYVNTIPRALEPPFPGEPAVERRLRSIVRWNAICMVLRANKISSELGGHIATYQSLATLMEVGFNHFWHGPSGRARRGPRLLPGPLLAGQLRPRLSRGPADRGAARRLPPGGVGAGRAELLSAPLADARVLAVPDGVARASARSPRSTRRGS